MANNEQELELITNNVENLRKILGYKISDQYYCTFSAICCDRSRIEWIDAFKLGLSIGINKIGTITIEAIVPKTN